MNDLPLGKSIKAELLGVAGLEEPEPESPYIDWGTFWNRDRTSEEWAFHDVLAKGRSHVIFAEGKTGKSLFALLMATSMLDTCRVVYLDWEQTEDDIYERLSDMGYGPESDLSNFHYMLWPTIQPLDTMLGAVALEQHLKALPDDGMHVVVILDTFSRAVEGDENSADTTQDYYRHTGVMLKRRGCTVLRLDHVGLEGTRARGSSAKGEDVDVSWNLVRSGSELTLKRWKNARMSWVKESVHFSLGASPLKLIGGATKLPEDELADLFDRCGLELDATVLEANALIKAETGSGRRTDLVGRALKRYKVRSSYPNAA